MHHEKLTLPEAKARFEKDKPNKQKNRDILLFCRGCSPQPHLQEKLLPLREFVSAWDQEEWYRVLSDGMCRLCTQCKTKQSGPAAKGKPKAVNACAYCQTLPADQTGYCSKCAKIRLACSKRDIGKKIKTKSLLDFSPEEIARRKKNKELRRARCKKCAVAPVTAKAKQGLCSNCNRAVSVLHLVNYSAESQTGVCRTCIAKQERAPKTCAKCAQPLHANATPGTWCTTCAFPPCSGGCGQPRPPKGIQPCQAESRLVLPKLQGKMCELWQPLAKDRRGRHMVCHMCISTMQWRLRRATPRKTSQPCKTPAEMVLSTLQCSETMCHLCRPFAEQCRGRHMVCHMCISTMQWRLRRAPST